MSSLHDPNLNSLSRNARWYAMDAAARARAEHWAVTRRAHDDLCICGWSGRDWARHRLDAILNAALDVFERELRAEFEEDLRVAEERHGG